MSLKYVTDLLPCEAARACFERAYPLAVRACLPPAGQSWIDPESGPYASPDDLVTALTQQFEVEVCRVLGLPYREGYDLARLVEVAA